MDKLDVIIANLVHEFDRNLKVDTKEIFINVNANDSDANWNKSESQSKNKEFEHLEGHDLVVSTIEKNVDFSFMTKKLSNHNFVESWEKCSYEMFKFLEYEHELNKQDVQYIEKDNINIKQKWKFINDMYSDGIKHHNMYKAIDACRLMLEEFRLLDCEKQLPHITVYQLQKNVLYNYKTILDKTSVGGLNNYSKEIRALLRDIEVHPKCNEWKSNIHLIDVNKLCGNYSQCEECSLPNLSNYPQFLTYQSNVSEQAASNYIMDCINNSLHNFSKDNDKSLEHNIVKKVGKSSINLFGNKNLAVASNVGFKRKLVSSNDSVNVEVTAATGSLFDRNNKFNNGSKNFLLPDFNVEEKIEKPSMYLKNPFSYKGLTTKKKRSNVNVFTNDDIDLERMTEESSNVKRQKSDVERGQLTFKTANDMLFDQNIKSNCGNKRLGNRPGPSTKFVSPFNKEKDEEKKDYKASTEESDTNIPDDERLKGIDPKMVKLMLDEIMVSGNPVSWKEIAGLEFVKNTLQEMITWPLSRPDLFTGLIKPPKGILLFGPPGTGKTLIGRCIASQLESTFFYISASSLSSKWYGEGEKLARALFAVARCYQPSVIFIDEIDSLLIKRSDQDHEASRKLKTELLVQIEGAKTSSNETLLVIGATNRPQDLDEAALRRLVKRFYIPLPGSDARIQIVKTLLADQNHLLSDDDYEILREKTAGYSGADMTNLCKEAAFGPIRRLNVTDIRTLSKDDISPIQIEDFNKALKQIRASVSDSDLTMYQEWNNKYGSS